MSPKIYKRLFHHQGILLVTLVFFSLLVLFTNLGTKSFWEPDEGRYAEISREMVESGDWLTPRLNYIKHFDKPPITYWLIGSSFKLFGLKEFAGHLPLVIIGLAGVLVTFFLGKRLFGKRCGFLSAIILISSLGYPALARVLSTDIIFAFFCLLCYLFFVQKKYFLFYLAMALGFMTKGPVVFIITLVPICVFLLFEKRIYAFKEMRLGRGLILLALVGLPWYIYEIRINPGLAYDWFFQQTIDRIVRQTYQPFYFFIPVTMGLFFPWIFFLVPAIKRASLRKNALLLLWACLPFLFFSCIGKKLVPYILPLLPPLAIITGRLWDEAIENPRLLTNKIFTLSYYIFLSCMGILLTAMAVFLSLGFDYKYGFQAGRLNIIVLCIILAGGIAASLPFFKLKKVGWLFTTIALTSSLFLLTAIDFLPKIEVNIGKSLKRLALEIKEDLKPEDKVVTYRCFLKSLPFYLERRTIIVERERNIAYEENPQHYQGYLLKDKQDLYNLLSAKEFKVFCITYTWEFEKIGKEYAKPLYLLGRAGKYVLFTNKK